MTCTLLHPTLGVLGIVLSHFTIKQTDTNTDVIFPIPYIDYTAVLHVYTTCNGVKYVPVSLCVCLSVCVCVYVC